MKKTVTILLSVTGMVAVAVGAYLSYKLVWLAFTMPTTAVIHYSSKQVDVLKDTASALIPTVAGFAALAASGAGYLYTRRYLRTPFLRLSVLSVFLALVVSMACFVVLLGAVVDCSRPFERLESPALSPKITAADARNLQRTYATAVTSARLACLSFFFALDVTLLVASQVFFDQSDPPEDEDIEV